MSFSIAAMPVSLMLQHKHPFGSSKNSSDCSAVGSSGDEILIALAVANSSGYLEMLTTTKAVAQLTFDVLYNESE